MLEKDQSKDTADQDDLSEQADHLRQALRGEAEIARYLFESDIEGILR